MKTTHLISLANESTSPDRVPLVGLSNAISTDAGDGWALIPYGEWPHAEGLQRFGKADAEEMVGYFRNTWNRIKRAVVGMPIFRGHPDLPALANQYPDKTTYGSIADMEARDEGLAIKPILTEAGALLVNEKGLNHFSPHWLAKKLGVERGRQVYAPALLVSIGLTDRPNIPGTSLVNEQPELTPIMKQLLLQLLAALGRPLANEATDEQITTGATEALTVATELSARPEPTALANEQTARTTAETELAATKTKLTEAETALANERTALANERKAHATALVNTAVAEGRITEAQKPVWQTRLERDFATESTALANEKGAVKTHGRTAGMGARKQTSGAATQFTALVNEALPGCNGDRDQAWAKVKASEAGKALLAQMEKASATA
jgi:hypothetical protein